MEPRHGATEARPGVRGLAVPVELKDGRDELRAG